MNRLDVLAGRSSSLASDGAWPTAIGIGKGALCVRSGSGASDAQAFYTPLHYEPNYAYPLVVWLHSASRDERELMQIIPKISLRNFVAVSPRGAAMAPATAGGAGYDWPQDAETASAAHERIARVIDAARRRFHIAPRRIFVAGAGAGGTMALRFALDEPRLVAGVASLGGALPPGRKLGLLHQVRRLQVLLSCHRQSAYYPPPAVGQDLSLLHSAGIPIVVREYPGEDEMSAGVLADVNRWIMDLVCPSSVSSEPSQQQAREGQ